MFPIRMGMNRHRKRTVPRCVYVPHTHGDEPQVADKRHVSIKCSPYAWG